MNSSEQLGNFVQPAGGTDGLGQILAECVDPFSRYRGAHFDKPRPEPRCMVGALPNHYAAFGEYSRQRLWTQAQCSAFNDDEIALGRINRNRQAGNGVYLLLDG